MLSKRVLISLAVTFATCAVYSQTALTGTPVQNVEKADINTRVFYPQIDHSVLRNPIHPENPPPDIDFDGAKYISPIKVGGIENNGNAVVSSKFPGISATGWTPPDTSFAVGPNECVQVVNSSLAFFNKSNGAKTFEQTFGTFFSTLGVGSFLYDPKVVYDRQSQRFLVLVLEQSSAGSISKLCIGVSDDNNPTGTWHLYRIEASKVINGNNSWLDYPGWGSNKDAIVCSGNMFGFSTGFTGMQFIVMSKAQMLSGGTPTVTSIVTTQGFTSQICDMLDTSISKIYAISRNNSTSLRLWTLTNLLTGPTLNFSNVAVPSHSSPGVNATLGSGQSADALDGRLFGAMFKSNKIVTGHTINSAHPLAVRWYDININTSTDTGTLNQSGDITSGAKDVHMGVVGINGVGQIGSVFSVSGGTSMADIGFAFRSASDPAGSMGAITTLGTSAGNSYSDGRWGDYAGIGIDPVNDNDFWVSTMTVRAGGGWTTQFFKVVTQTFALSSVTVANPIIEGGQSTTGTITLTASSSSTQNVSLSDNAGANITIQSSISVPAGALTANFTINTAVVTSTINATITASLLGVTKTTPLAVVPVANLSSLAISPTSVSGGSNATGTITLDRVAGVNKVVSLSDNGPELSVPSSATVNASSSSTTFTITTIDPSVAVTRTVSATLGSVTKTASLTITGVQIINAGITPANVVGGNPASERVTLSGPAPAGYVLTVRDTDSRTNVPATVTVPEGATFVDFDITSQGTPVQFTSEIRVSRLRQTFKRYLVVYAPALSTFSIAPTIVTGGTSATGTITLNGKAFAAGIYVNVSSDGAEATVPATVGFGQNVSQKTFEIKTKPVAVRVIRTITVSYNGVTKTKTLTINH